MRLFCSSENKRCRDWFQYFLPVEGNCLSDKLIFLVHFPRVIKLKIPHKTEHLFIHKNPSTFIHAGWMYISSELSFTRKELWKVINAYIPFLRDMLQTNMNRRAPFVNNWVTFNSYCKADRRTDYYFLALVSTITINSYFCKNTLIHNTW